MWRPKTLRLRAFLLIAALLVISLAAAFSLFRHTEHTPRAMQMAQRAKTVVKITRTALRSADPEWRTEFLSDLEDEGVSVRRAGTEDVLLPLEEGFPEPDTLKVEVRRSLGKKTRFASSLNGTRGVWISFTADRDDYWVSLPETAPAQDRTVMLIFWGGLILGVAVLGGYGIALQVVAPLRKLAEAAHDLGKGSSPQWVPESGPQEIANVSRAFNEMAKDLAGIERERAMVLAGISHDLRTPLTRARLAVEMSGDADLSQGVVGDIEQMDEIIQQFMDYARLNKEESFVCADVVQLVLEVADSWKKKGLDLDVKTPESLWVDVRPFLLKRALANLVDNAFKYGDGGVECCVEVDAQSGWVVRVLDAGQGIPEGSIDKVRRPFVRLQEARSDVTGSGLGLAIVDRTASLHGGSFFLRNRPEGGLEAGLHLPLHQNATL